MPILSMFYGIIVRMYYSDNKQHHVPHIHVEYGSDHAVFLHCKRETTCWQIS